MADSTLSTEKPRSVLSCERDTERNRCRRIVASESPERRRSSRCSKCMLMSSSSLVRLRKRRIDGDRASSRVSARVIAGCHLYGQRGGRRCEPPRADPGVQGGRLAGRPPGGIPRGKAAGCWVWRSGSWACPRFGASCGQRGFTVAQVVDPLMADEGQPGGVTTSQQDRGLVPGPCPPLRVDLRSDAFMILSFLPIGNLLG